MIEGAVLFSENIEDLLFVREKSEKILRYASDFKMLQRILEKFAPQTVICNSSSPQRIKDFIKSSGFKISEYSTKAELEKYLRQFEFDSSEREQASFENSSNLKNLSEISPTFASLVGSSPAMQKIRRMILRIAVYDVSVLILGETGTGKTSFARAIHELSARREKPFKDCVLSNSNESLVESKLFGVAEGGFTGAVAGKGLFEECDGGTLFLDEIGEISAGTQTKLLQVLSEGVINRIGSNEDIKVDDRMIFATNANLEAKIKLGEFREDLFYRINDVTLRIPPLRERLEDIPDLCREILRREKINKEISDSAISAMQTFSWKGNVRQLEKCIRNAALLYCDGDVIEPKDIKL